MLRVVSAWRKFGSNAGNPGANPLWARGVSQSRYRRAMEMVHEHSSKKKKEPKILQDHHGGNNSEELSSSSSSHPEWWEHIPGVPKVLKIHSSRDGSLENTWMQGHSGSRTPGISSFKISGLHSSAVKWEIPGNHFWTIHWAKHQQGLLQIQSSCNQLIDKLLFCATIIHLVSVTTPSSFKSQHPSFLLIGKIREQRKWTEKENRSNLKRDRTSVGAALCVGQGSNISEWCLKLSQTTG